MPKKKIQKGDSRKCNSITWKRYELDHFIIFPQEQQGKRKIRCPLQLRIMVTVSPLFIHTLRCLSKFPRECLHLTIDDWKENSWKLISINSPRRSRVYRSKHQPFSIPYASSHCTRCESPYRSLILTCWSTGGKIRARKVSLHFRSQT